MFASFCPCPWLCFSIAWVASLLLFNGIFGLGALVWLVIPGLISDFYLCLPCLVLPLCWDSFLYLVLFDLSDGMTLLPSSQVWVCFSLVLFFQARRKGLTSHLLSALRVSRSEPSGQNPAT